MLYFSIIILFICCYCRFNIWKKKPFRSVTLTSPFIKIKRLIYLSITKITRCPLHYVQYNSMSNSEMSWLVVTLPLCWVWDYRNHMFLWTLTFHILPSIMAPTTKNNIVKKVVNLLPVYVHLLWIIFHIPIC